LAFWDNGCNIVVPCAGSIAMPESQFITYAQNAEDVMLWRALKHVQHGFYIDVGAQDPVVDSVTKAFYERGWRGINIEPVEQWYQRLMADRPHDINLQVAASDHCGEITFFEIEGTGLSTSNVDLAQRHGKAGWAVHERIVPCTTVDTVCKDNGIEIVHFLKIDCEASERQVLSGLSLKLVRPWVVVVEATEPLSAVGNWEEWESLFTARI
jgi:FkbM family methyltransferase